MRHVRCVRHGTIGFIFILYAVTGRGSQWGVKARAIKRCSVFNFYETLTSYLEKKKRSSQNNNKQNTILPQHTPHHITSHDLQSCSDLCLDLSTDHKLASVRIIWKIHLLLPNFYVLFPVLNYLIVCWCQWCH